MRTTKGRGNCFRIINPDDLPVTSDTRSDNGDAGVPGGVDPIVMALVAATEQEATRSLAAVGLCAALTKNKTNRPAI